MNSLSNDNPLFLVRFSSVNGSGSQSINTLFARMVFRHQMIFTAKNRFPSNIKGMPTYYDVSVSLKGEYQAYKRRPDVLVSLNPGAIIADTAQLEEDGVFFLDSRLKGSAGEDDRYIFLPISDMVHDISDTSMHRLLLQNTVALGVICSYLCLEESICHEQLRAAFGHSQKMLDKNLAAFKCGVSAWKAIKQQVNNPHQERIEALHSNKVGPDPQHALLMDGNAACALGAMDAGAGFVSWYPITPSTSLIESFEKYAKSYSKTEETYAFASVQAEDEIAACAMAMGAGWMGARAYTATSGPGLSLMQEMLGYAYYAEIPFVLFVIQRCGPSTGMPTKQQQADILLAHYASHGDTQHVVLMPSSIEECFSFAALAFDLSEDLQAPVIVLSDIELGMSPAVSPVFVSRRQKASRGKIVSKQDLESMEHYYRYLDMDGDGVPTRVLPGTHPSKGAYLTRGSGHDEWGKYTEEGQAYQKNLDRLQFKIQESVSRVPKPLHWGSFESKVAIIFCGSSRESCSFVFGRLAGKFEIEIAGICLRGLPIDKNFLRSYKKLQYALVIEQNQMGQLLQILKGTLTPISGMRWDSLRIYDGESIDACDLYEKVTQKITHFLNHTWGGGPDHDEQAS